MDVTVLLGVIGVLAFVVSMITEVIKGLGVLNKVRTGWIVVVLSLIITPTAFCIYKNMNDQPCEWYEIVLSLIGGFVVAYVSMYGWEKLKDLWENKKNQ